MEYAASEIPRAHPKPRAGTHRSTSASGKVLSEPGTRRNAGKRAPTSHLEEIGDDVHRTPYPDLETRVSALLERMSLEDRVGQVFMFGFHGRDPEGARALVKELRAGGIIYFARNTGPLEQVAALSRSLQDMALTSGPRVPLFISADQEGGIVCRLTQGFPVMPGHMALAAADGPELVERVAEAIGTGLRLAGINMNLAPVLDVNDNRRNPVIGVRSFGSDPSRVADLGAAYARGLRESGVIPVGKHFPGHGNTSVDSHLDLPVLESPMDRLERVELVPFRRAIAEGLECIMSAHILFKALDSVHPATLSERILGEFLRDELGFSGIVMTDCLEMNAIARSPGTVKGAVEAFRAGADMLLISHTSELQKAAYEALMGAVRSGEIPEGRLNASVARILRLKILFGLPNPLDPSGLRPEDWGTYRELSREAHRNSITLVKNERGIVPLRAGARVTVVTPDDVEMLRVEDSEERKQGAFTSLARALLERGFVAEDTSYSRFVPNDPGDSDCIIVVAHGACRSAYQSEFLAKLRDVSCRSGRPGSLPRRGGEAIPVILVAAREPYDLSLFPEVETYLCTYGSRQESMEALADVLVGVAPPRGKLPVALELS